LLLILFKIENERFGLESSRIIEVVPMASMKKAHNMPEYVAGFLNFRGMVVPVIDVSSLISGNLTKPLLSSRIIIVLFKSANGMLQLIGLLAEHVIETMNVMEDEFHSPGLENDNARYLGKIRIDDEGMLQMINVDDLLSEELQELLLS